MKYWVIFCILEDRYIHPFRMNEVVATFHINSGDDRKKYLSSLNTRYGYTYFREGLGGTDDGYCPGVCPGDLWQANDLTLETLPPEVKAGWLAYEDRVYEESRKSEAFHSGQ